MKKTYDDAIRACDGYAKFEINRKDNGKILAYCKKFGLGREAWIEGNSFYIIDSQNGKECAIDLARQGLLLDARSMDAVLKRF